MKHYYEILLSVPVHLLEESYDYIKSSDAAHNEEHIRTVVRHTDTLCDKGGVNPKDKTCALIAALTHDLGCSVRGGRAKHEVYSAQITRGLLHGIYSDEDSDSIILAVLQHRSSYTGRRESKISNIVAAADRSDALNIPLLFYRSYVYSRDVDGADHYEAIYHSYIHVTSKYGRSSKRCLLNNDIMMEFYPDECEYVTETLDSIGLEKVRKLIEFFGE